MMPNFNLILKEEAAKEAVDSYIWYEKQRNGLGDEFLSSVQKTIEFISDKPFSFQKIFKNFRQAAVGRFPFAVVYEIEEMDLIVYAIFHKSRNPKKKFRK